MGSRVYSIYLVIPSETYGECATMERLCRECCGGALKLTCQIVEVGIHVATLAQFLVHLHRGIEVGVLVVSINPAVIKQGGCESETMTQKEGGDQFQHVIVIINGIIATDVQVIEVSTRCESEGALMPGHRSAKTCEGFVGLRPVSQQLMRQAARSHKAFRLIGVTSLRAPSQVGLIIRGVHIGTRGQIVVEVADERIEIRA